jgi:AcrR family transcriptional regulator
MSTQSVKSKTRRYVSIRRQQQADETRTRIAHAARSLMGRLGYAATTIGSIANEAGVAPQTVYAVFRSKQGILKTLIDSTIFNPRYEQLVEAAFAEKEPAARLRFAAEIACEIYESDRTELEFFRNAGVPDAELIVLQREREDHRFQAQTAMIESLATDRAFRSGLDPAAAHDLLWALTGRDIYRLLVVERKWKADRYRRWLAELLVTQLLPLRSQNGKST